MQRIAYRGDLVAEDIAQKGWLPIDVARRIHSAPSTVSRFISGRRQSARVAARIAKVLGQPIKRYLVRAA